MAFAGLEREILRRAAFQCAMSPLTNAFSKKPLELKRCGCLAVRLLQLLPRSYDIASYALIESVLTDHISTLRERIGA
jgi:hypothetical protein